MNGLTYFLTGSLQLLSSSIDKTLIIWSTTDDGVWMEKIRVGDVGGNSLGFFGGKFSPNGKSILGHGFQGSFHIWNQSHEDASSWLPGIVIGGHFNVVQDLAWEPNGLFLITVSADQTTRIHVPWVRPSFDEHVGVLNANVRPTNAKNNLFRIILDLA